MAKEIDWFGRTEFGKEIEKQDIPSTENDWEENEINLAEANKTCGIPVRFWNARLADYPSEITDKFKKFALQKNNDNIFGICGNVGTGKTYTVCAGMHERVIAGMNAGLFLSCRILKPMIMTSRSFKADISEMDLYEKYSKTPFLVLDEIGKCSDAQIEWDFITTIIALRYDNGLPTAFTTNMDFGNFKTFICGDNNKGLDVYDRMHSVFIGEVMTGNSHRGE